MDPGLPAHCNPLRELCGACIGCRGGGHVPLLVSSICRLGVYHDRQDFVSEGAVPANCSVPSYSDLHILTSGSVMHAGLFIFFVFNFNSRCLE